MAYSTKHKQLNMASRKDSTISLCNWLLQTVLLHDLLNHNGHGHI